jgi:hypothetical protein
MSRPPETSQSQKALLGFTIVYTVLHVVFYKIDTSFLDTWQSILAPRRAGILDDAAAREMTRYLSQSMMSCTY